MRIDLLGWDVGVEDVSAEAFIDRMIETVAAAWDEGADLVLLPEFSWMPLERFVVGSDKLAAVAAMAWETGWPRVQSHLKRSGKAAVLGTAPFRHEDGTLRNRAMILGDGQSFHQDKLNLTPWESDFTGGDELHVWEFLGMRMAVVICLDIEMPEISVALRGAGIDVLLVPSATENILGVERVHRCASARAVELGCHVAVAPLLGRMTSDLIDENVGRVAVYSPSQSAFAMEERENRGGLMHKGVPLMTASVDRRPLFAARSATGETNPAMVIPGTFSVRIASL